MKKNVLSDIFLRRCSIFLPLAAWFCLATQVAHAAKLFAVTAEYGPSTSQNHLMVENSSFGNLIDDLINNYHEFSVLQHYDEYVANIRFFAVPNTFSFAIDKNNGNGLYEVTMSSSLTSLSKTFEAVDSEDMQRQIVNWLLLDGDDEAKELLEAILKHSTAAISDGSPEASTAQMADSAFYLFGLYQGYSSSGAMRGSESGAHFSMHLNSASSTIESPVGPLQGDRLTVSVPLWLHFNSRVSYVGQMDYGVFDLEGTKFYDLGLQMGLAIRPVVREETERFGWQVTPFVGADATASADGVTAAVLYHYGLNNRFEWRVLERARLAFSTQYSPLESVTLAIDDYELSTEVDQAILKNGVMFEMPVVFRSVYGHLFITDTRFLEDFGTDNYRTYGVGISFRTQRFAVGVNTLLEVTDTTQRRQLQLSLGWEL